MMQIVTSTQLTAVILAGGMGRRMGGQDKGQLKFQGQPLIELILKAIRPQVEHILINANRNQEEYARYGFPVCGDRLEGYQGPLAGFAAAMAASPTPYIVTLPCDGPFVVPDLVSRMLRAINRNGADIAVAHDGKRLQPVYALLPTRLLPDLESFLASGGRKIDRWYTQHRMALADFSDAQQMFMNINTPEDRQQLQQEALSE